MSASLGRGPREADAEEGLTEANPSRPLDQMTTIAAQPTGCHLGLHPLS